MKHERPHRKTATNLSLDAALVEEAKALGVNLSEAGAAGIAAAVKAERERRWKQENAEAIRSWNEWVAENGLPLEEYRQF